MWQWNRIDSKKLTIQSNKLDIVFWQGLLSKNQQLHQTFPDKSSRHIGMDMFQALYQFTPNPAKPSPDPALSAYLARLQESPEFQALKQETVLDSELSAAGSISLYRELMRPKESELKVIKQLQDNAEMLQVLPPEASKPALDGIRQAQENLAQTMQVAGTVKALQNATENIQAVKELSGYDTGGNPSSRVLGMLLDEQLVTRISQMDKVRRVLKLSGRLRMILSAAKSVKPVPAPPPVDLIIGDELEYLVAGELGLLADPETEDLFYVRLLEKQLLMYKHEAREKQGQGPFIACIDYSGSMGGRPQVFALALFVAMARLAVEEHRVVGFLPFADYSLDEPVLVKTSQDVLRVINNDYNLGWGTDFTYPLLAADKCIASQRVCEHADVLLITDGQGEMTDAVKTALLRSKQALGWRLYGLGINAQWEDSMKGLLDVAVEVSRTDLNSDKDFTWIEELA